jgi:hypothetical protein
MTVIDFDKYAAALRQLKREATHYPARDCFAEIVEPDDAVVSLPSDTEPAR